MLQSSIRLSELEEELWSLELVLLSNRLTHPYSPRGRRTLGTLHCSLMPRCASLGLSKRVRECLPATTLFSAGDRNDVYPVTYPQEVRRRL